MKTPIDHKPSVFDEEKNTTACLYVVQKRGRDDVLVDDERMRLSCNARCCAVLRSTRGLQNKPREGGRECVCEWVGVRVTVGS